MAVEKELIKGIEQMIQGKEEGFNTLYSYTYNYVYGRAKMIMKDEQDALDLTQETFIYAYRGIHSLENVNNIYAWLGGIVYRNGMKMFRKKRDILVNEDGEDIFENIVSEGMESSPEGTAEEKATSEVIKDMIEELPELQRAAIMAFYYDNMKIDEIAEAFECSANTIKSRLNYAKKFLKEKVEMHEKKYAYKLLSINPMVIFLAFKALLGGTKYTLSTTTAQGVYTAAGTALGFAPGAIIAGGAGAAGATMTAASTAVAGTSAVGGATAAATTGATAVTTGITAATTTAAATTTIAATAATTVGMTLGVKLAIGIATAVTVGTMAVGGVAISNNGGFENLFSQDKEEQEDDRGEENSDDENADNENTDSGNVDDDSTGLPKEELDFTIAGVYKENDWLCLPDSYYDGDGNIVYNGLWTATIKYFIEEIPRVNFAEMLEETRQKYTDRGYSYMGDEDEFLWMDESLFEEKNVHYFQIKLTDSVQWEELRKIMLKSYVDSGKEIPKGDDFNDLMDRIDQIIDEVTTLGIRIRWNSYGQTYSLEVFSTFAFNDSGYILLNENFEYYAHELVYDAEKKVWYLPE